MSTFRGDIASERTTHQSNDSYFYDVHTHWSLTRGGWSPAGLKRGAAHGVGAEESRARMRLTGRAGARCSASTCPRSGAAPSRRPRRDLDHRPATRWPTRRRS